MSIPDLSAEALAKAENKLFANALNLIVALGPVKLRRLLDYFGDFASAWQANASDYQNAGLDQKTISQIIAKKPDIDPEQAWAQLEKAGIQVVLITDDAYPKLLSQIHNPPPILYVRGNIRALNTDSISVVGTRKMSLYGRQATSELVTQLLAANLTIASGLAFGVDAEALNTTLKAGGIGIAVLASSLDNQSISPKVNFNLAMKLIDNGCLVSEYPLGVTVQKQNFPQRNRMISGLSLGTLVIEADEESGALITANYALEQNREVFAVPGSIFSPTSRGTNQLIKKGAKLVSSAFDIIEELNLDTKITLPQEGFEETEEEIIILTKLSREPIHIDDLIRELKRPPSEVNSLLTMLELKGRIKNLGGAKYIKIR